MDLGALLISYLGLARELTRLRLFRDSLAITRWYRHDLSQVVAARRELQECCLPTLCRVWTGFDDNY